MTIGSLSLSPVFDSKTLDYTASTTNATNTITVTPTDSNAMITIDVGGTAVAKGASATWASGVNIVTITVTNGTSKTIYTIKVTKS